MAFGLISRNFRDFEYHSFKDCKKSRDLALDITSFKTVRIETELESESTEHESCILRLDIMNYVKELRAYLLNEYSTRMRKLKWNHTALKMNLVFIYYVFLIESNQGSPEWDGDSPTMQPFTRFAEILNVRDVFG